MRDSKWTESIAVERKAFAAMVKKQLGLRAMVWRITESPGGCQLRETQFPYTTISGGENGPLGSHKLYLWNLYRVISDIYNVARPCSPLHVSKEIQDPCLRYALIDHQCLQDLLGILSMEMLQRSDRNWVARSLGGERSVKNSDWLESIAVGRNAFLAIEKIQLGLRAKSRKVTESPSECQLRETQFPYSTISGGENGPLSSHNLHFWNIYHVESDA